MGKILSDYEATYITKGLSFLLVFSWGHSTRPQELDFIADRVGFFPGISSKFKSRPKVSGLRPDVSERRAIKMVATIMMNIFPPFSHSTFRSQDEQHFRFMDFWEGNFSLYQSKISIVCKKTGESRNLVLICNTEPNKMTFICGNIRVYTLES